MEGFHGNKDIQIGEKENTLEVIAAIETIDENTWQIKVMNRDTKEIAICKNIAEYSSFLENAAANSNKEYFKATWLPSRAKWEHIQQVKEELFKYQNELEGMQEEVKNGKEK